MYLRYQCCQESPPAIPVSDSTRIEHTHTHTHTHTHYGHWDLSPDTGQELTLFFNSKGRRGAG